MKNTIALNYWVLGGFDGQMQPEQAIDTVKSFGLEGIELTFGDCLPVDISRERLDDIRAHAERQSVRLQTLATGHYWGCSLASQNSEEREEAIRFTTAYIDAAAALGAETILIVAGAVDVAWDETVPVTPYQAVWDNATDSIRRVLPYAEKKSVNIAVENVWSKFLLSPIEMKEFVDQFQCDRLGAYFDVGNVAATGYAEHWIPVLGERIFAVHVKNYQRSDCLGGLHGFGDDLKTGAVNFPAVIDALKAIKYEGPITAEMIPFCRLPDLNLPDHALAKDTSEKLLDIFKDY